MPDYMECPECESLASLYCEYGVIRSFKCKACGLDFDSFAYYSIDEKFVPPPSFGVSCHVDKNLSKLERLKLKIKLKNIFSGYSNFHISDMEEQLEKELVDLELGVYSEREVEELLIKSKNAGLNISFKPI